MPASLSQTEDDIITAIRTFLLSILPDGAVVVQSQQNRVPEPAANSYILITPLDRLRLATNIEQWDFTADDPTTWASQHSTDFRVQLDLHGDAYGSDWTQLIATLIQGDVGFAMMPDLVKPLYATDGHQMPFVNGQNQYENRWVMTLGFQVAPIVSTTMQFADTLTPTLILVTGED